MKPQLRGSEMARHTIQPKRNGGAPRRPRTLTARGAYERSISGLTLRDGDYLKLANQWANLTITLEVDHEGDGAEERGMPRFTVDGDVMPQAKKAPVFDTMAEAVGYAFVCLTYYAEGRLS